MGAWQFIQPYLEELLTAKVKLTYVGRDRSASPATGSHALHDHELKEILRVVSHE